MSTKPDVEAAMQAVAQATAMWVDGFVIEQGLCPFARVPADEGRVAYRVTLTRDASQLAEDFADLVLELREAAPAVTETALLVHPFALVAFGEYNDFLDIAEGLLGALGLEREFQVASFHPEYCFDGVDSDDPANYSNRSPFPMLHLLRQVSVGAAVDAHPDSEAIPDRNIVHLRRLGAAVLADGLEALRSAAQPALDRVRGR